MEDDGELWGFVATLQNDVFFWEFWGVLKGVRDEETTKTNKQKTGKHMKQGAKNNHNKTLEKFKSVTCF